MPAIPPKSVFKSKTAFASALTFVAGAMGSMLPDVNQHLATHASTILLILGPLNFLLRLVTKNRVVLFPE